MKSKQQNVLVFLQQPTMNQAENKDFTWRFTKLSVLIWNFLG